MTKNDIHAIIYYILKYLYTAKQQGFVIREDIVLLKEYPAAICEEYAEFTLLTMLDEGLIKGLDVMDVPALGGCNQRVIKDVSRITITLTGIEYLSENNMMAKAYDTLKKFKDAIPFI